MADDAYTAIQRDGVWGVYAGWPTPAPPSPPAWMVAGQWVEASSSTLEGSAQRWTGTSPDSFATSDYRAIVRAWGGGVLVSGGIYDHTGTFRAGDWLVIFGGGHGDYAGNELYGFGPLADASPAWVRLIDPTIPAPRDVARASGRPVSRHTYDSLQYLPATRQMLAIGAPGYFATGFVFNVGDLYSFDANPTTANPWTTADTNFPAFGGGGMINGLSARHSGTGAVWCIGNGNGTRLGRYLSGAWSSWAFDNPDGPSRSKAAIDPRNSVMAFLTNAGALRAIDLRPTTPTGIYAPSTSGTAPTGDVALDWDSDANVYRAWSDSGRTLYTLTPPANPYAGGGTWAWSSITPGAGATPSLGVGTNGVYGRFRVMSGSGWSAAVLMTGTDRPVYGYLFE